MNTLSHMKKSLALLITLSLSFAGTAQCFAAVLPAMMTPSPASLSLAAKPEPPCVEPASMEGGESGLKRRASRCQGSAEQRLGRSGNNAPVQAAPSTLAFAAGLGEAAGARVFDGSNASGRAPAVSFPAAPAARPGASAASAVALGNGISLRPAAPPPSPAPSLHVGRPPSNWKGRIARVAGALSTGLVAGGISSLLWGPAAGAYYLTGSVLKIADYDSDVLGKIPHKIFAELDKHAALLRFGAGVALTVGGTLTFNPVMTYVGISFVAFGGGELVSKLIFKGSMKALDTKPAAEAGRAIDAGFQHADGFVSKELGRKEGAAATAPTSRLGRDFDRMDRYLSAHKASIAKTAIASAITMATMGVGTYAVSSLLDGAMGVMASQGNANTFGDNLSFQDKAYNTLIGGYRLYNLPAVLAQSGPNTQAFYAKMKAQYNPKTPEDWANLIDNNVTWTDHGELYGNAVYYVSSEEASQVRTFNGVPGYYSDCTGKAALLQNMLKMDGYGSSQVVNGVSTTDWMSGHYWVVNPNADSADHSLFHYSNTLNMKPTEVETAAQGIQGDHAAAFAAGGIGGVVTDLVYKGLDGLDRRIQKIRGTQVPAPSN